MMPKFGNDHVVSADQIPEEGTNYHIVDPSHGKNWVMIWVRVAPDGKCYVYREVLVKFIQLMELAWQESGQLLVKRSMETQVPAQQPFGWSFMIYKQEIEKLEEVRRSHAG